MDVYAYGFEEHISALPRSLLLLAEPDEAMIDDYSPDCIAAVARIDDDIVGAAVFLRDHDTAEIINLAVHQAHRNLGIGTALLERAINYTREHAARRLVIRTASTSTSQLLLYQRIGFRISEIDHGYFTRNYVRPLIENGVRCIDQVSLVYSLYRPAEKRALVDDYWCDFVLRNPEFVGSNYAVWSFGDGPLAANELLNLVIEGRKTATASAQETLAPDGRALPIEAQISVVTYGDGRPGAILKTTAVRVCAFQEVDEDHARLEGEGDLSLAHWRDMHRKYLSRELDRHGKSFSETMPVVCERFSLLDVNRELALG